MKNILDILPPEHQNNPHMHEARIAEAYAALFTGNGGTDDADLVLVDLAQYSRYYVTAPLGMPADQVKALDQRRAVVERILEAVIRSGHRIGDLHEAVLRAPDQALPAEG